MPGPLADSLIYLMDDIYQTCKFPMLLTTQDLADLSGMAKDSAEKALRQFQHDGIIPTNDHKMEILDVEALKRISRTGYQTP